MTKIACEFSPEPFRVNHIRKTLEERFALTLDLLTKTVMRDEVDVLQSILARDGDVAPICYEIQCFCQSEFYKKWTVSGLR